MKRAIISLIASAAVGASGFAAATSFDLKDPKGVNNIVFLLDAPLESINGTATGISGSITFDPAKPEATSGTVEVAVDSLTVPNPKMGEHLMGDKWMDAETFPEITFEVERLSDVSKSGQRIYGTAHGVMTIKGTSKEVEVPVTLTHLEGMMKQRQGEDGDILVIRSSFAVKRSDFGVNTGNLEDKVSDEVELRLSLAGFAPEAK